LKNSFIFEFTVLEGIQVDRPAPSLIRYRQPFESHYVLDIY
jgi:hypothetical protein